MGQIARIATLATILAAAGCGSTPSSIDASAPSPAVAPSPAGASSAARASAAGASAAGASAAGASAAGASAAAGLPPAGAPSAAGSAPAATTPEGRFAVGKREFRWSRGKDRPLRTVLLYPALPATPRQIPAPAPAVVTPYPGSAPHPGRFPLVLFSHGLHGSPEGYSPAAASWAAAGFVVALPAYPYTNKKADPYLGRKDIKNQPADAAHVLRKLIKLADKPGDPLRGHIDTSRIAAVGHSAGGYTTTGLFRKGHDKRLRAGVVIAGWMAPGRFAGPPAELLFLHADNDKVVPIADGRAAYAESPWPKTFKVLQGATHAAFMLPRDPAYAEMDRLVTDFLRTTLAAPGA